MDLPTIARQTARVLISYLTYEAVRTVVAQLAETDPPLAIWLNSYSSTSNIQDGEAYLEALLRERQDLALRVMVVREHLAETVVEHLPEMVQTGIRQANMERRRQHLERLTQIPDAASAGRSELESPPEPQP
ncbi:MAG: chaperonin family protein RbcX [Gloeomargaritaceae cyanobacterium C42_A2020_066]|nr:chaperonin family protein RbcX [Gloeomargaritaceae cyanobacterium C42_A2020_066]